MQIKLWKVFLLAFYMSSLSTTAASDNHSTEIDRQRWVSSYSILTPSFEILSAADLSIAAGNYQLVPYDPVTGTGAAYWQCFPKKYVSFNYETQKGNDSMGRSDVIVTMCSFEIQIHAGDLINNYLERSAHEASYCRELAKSWELLTHGEHAICLLGEAAGTEKKLISWVRKTVRNWVWRSFKTRKGCHSHFVNDCAVQ